MSRGVEGRRAAWETWRVLLTVGDEVPVGFVHQCGEVTLIGDRDLHELSCSGCRFEIADPARECDPIYGSPVLPGLVDRSHR